MFNRALKSSSSICFYLVNQVKIITESNYLTVRKKKKEAQQEVITIIITVITMRYTQYD